jgi:hypothetical protein
MAERNISTVHTATTPPADSPSKAAAPVSCLQPVFTILAVMLMFQYLMSWGKGNEGERCKFLVQLQYSSVKTSQRKYSIDSHHIMIGRHRQAQETGPLPPHLVPAHST